MILACESCGEHRRRSEKVYTGSLGIGRARVRSESMVPMGAGGLWLGGGSSYEVPLVSCQLKLGERPSLFPSRPRVWTCARRHPESNPTKGFKETARACLKANDDRESLTWTLHMSREFLDEIDLDELQNLLENSDTAGTLGATKSVQLTASGPGPFEGSPRQRGRPK